MVRCTIPPCRAAVRLNSGVRCRMRFRSVVALTAWTVAATALSGCSDASDLLPRTHSPPAAAHRAISAEAKVVSLGRKADAMSYMRIEGEYSNQSRHCSGTASAGYPRRVVPYTGLAATLPTQLTGPSAACPLLLTSVQFVLLDGKGKQVARGATWISAASAGQESHTCFVDTGPGYCLLNGAASLRNRERQREKEIGVVSVRWHTQPAPNNSFKPRPLRGSA